jgi:N-acetylglutamate synthase-like GNAT family acetyltransferase
MTVVIAGPLLGQSAVCVPILRLLPDWFGIEASILNYEQEIQALPTFLARKVEQVVGFLTLKQHTPFSAEIYVMGVHPEARRSGIGRSLVESAEAHARRLGIEYLQVKTLGPSRPDEGYTATRAFYAAEGFRPLEEFSQIWDKDNPCLILVKRL